MWFLLFVVGSMWFFALCGLAVIVLFLAVENEAPFWAAFTLIVYCAAMALFGDFNVVSWTLTHPVQMLAYAGGFFMIGAAWSVVKWWFYVRSLRDDYNEQKLRFIYEHKLGIKVTDQIPVDFLGRYADHLGHNFLGHARYARPKASSHKSQIMTWMMYWPFSMVWTLINDPIKNRIQGLYEWISNSLFTGVDEEMKAAREAQRDYNDKIICEEEEPSMPEIGGGNPMVGTRPASW